MFQYCFLGCFSLMSMKPEFDENNNLSKFQKIHEKFYNKDGNITLPQEDLTKLTQTQKEEALRLAMEENNKSIVSLSVLAILIPQIPPKHKGEIFYEFIIIGIAVEILEYLEKFLHPMDFVELLIAIWLAELPENAHTQLLVRVIKFANERGVGIQKLYPRKV